MRVDLDLDCCRALGDPDSPEMRGLLAELYAVYLRDTAARVADIRGAALAGDGARVRALAHGQKGASAMVGAVGLAECFAALERCADDPVAVDRELRRVAPAVVSLQDAVARLLDRPVLP